MILKLAMFAFALLEASSQQFIPRQSPCPSVEFINRTFDGWHGNLVVVPTSDVKGVQIEVTFDDFVPAFVVRILGFVLMRFKLSLHKYYCRIISRTLHRKTMKFSPLSTRKDL